VPSPGTPCKEKKEKGTKGEKGLEGGFGARGMESGNGSAGRRYWFQMRLLRNYIKVRKSGVKGDKVKKGKGGD